MRARMNPAAGFLTFRGPNSTGYRGIQDCCSATTVELVKTNTRTGFTVPTVAQIFTSENICRLLQKYYIILQGFIFLKNYSPPPAELGENTRFL